jgi:hypothetical protein
LIDRAGIGKQLGYEFVGKMISLLIGRLAGPTNACFRCSVLREASVVMPFVVLLRLI